MLFGADADIHMVKKKDEILIVCQTTYIKCV